jgi:transcriptional repressor NrdR
LRCPFCNTPDTQVKDSRVSDDGTYVKRRRFCEECGSRFNTFERVQMKEVFVKKSSGAVVPFDRAKLGHSIALACKKRPISADRIDKIVSSIQRRLESSGDAEVSSKEIAVLAMEMLSTIDRVAQIRFASVHYKFETGDDFLSFIKQVGPDSAADKKDAPAANDKTRVPQPAKKGELF